jgi:hypothetical protein
VLPRGGMCVLCVVWVVGCLRVALAAQPRAWRSACSSRRAGLFSIFLRLKHPDVDFRRTVYLRVRCILLQVLQTCWQD